jgi:hypothetical protein
LQRAAPFLYGQLQVPSIHLVRPNRCMKTLSSHSIDIGTAMLQLEPLQERMN